MPEKKAWNIILSFKLKCTLDYGSHFADLFHNPAWPFTLQTLSLSDLLSKCQCHVALLEINNGAPYGNKKKLTALATDMQTHLRAETREPRHLDTPQFPECQHSILWTSAVNCDPCRNTQNTVRKKKPPPHWFSLPAVCTCINARSKFP